MVGELTHAEIHKRLSTILKRLAPLTPEKAQVRQAPLGESDTIPMDSVVVLQLVLAIEEEFGVIIEDADIGPDNFGDFASLCAFVAAKLHS